MHPVKAGGNERFSLRLPGHDGIGVSTRLAQVKKVTFVEVGFPRLSDVMKAGSVDAALTTEPFKSRTIVAAAARLAKVSVELFRPIPPVALIPIAMLVRPGVCVPCGGNHAS
jgi:hypothetical protein